MKKTFCSILAGMVVAGSAFAAAPTIEDRRALCEKHPDKYVWVEKTGACIPINPCSALNAAYNSAFDIYCVEVGIDGAETDEAREMICKNRIEKEQNSKVSREGEFSDDKVKTFYMENGMYLGCWFVRSDECSDAIKNRIKDSYDRACSEFGGKSTVDDLRGKCANVQSGVCVDIADKVSLYSGCYTVENSIYGYDEYEHACNFVTDWATCAD